MQRNSYISWMSHPLSAAVCPTPHIWPEDEFTTAAPRATRALARARSRVVKSGVTSTVVASARTDVAGRPMASKEEFMNEEKLRILKMLEDGKVTAEQAAKLMEALDRSGTRPSESEIKKKWLHIRVAKDGRDTVNMRVPLALLKFGFKLAPQAVRHHGERARHRAERARERAERVREKAERTREKALRQAERARDKMRSKLSKELGVEPGVDIDDIVDRAFEESIAEAEEAIQESIEEAEEAVSETLENGIESLRDLDLNIDRILEMAHSEGFDGKILDVYDDDDDERVVITLE
jgi:hypothetical protein